MAVGRTVTLTHAIEMPIVGFGTWRLFGQDGYRAIRDSVVPREDIFVTTKLPPDRAGRERETIEASLRALGMEYVDLWLIHWPPDGRAHPKTWEQFLAARDEGLARAVGVSNYSHAQIDELTKATGQTPAVNQIAWSPAQYDAVRLAEHRERGVVVEGYSPIKSTNLHDLVLTSAAAAHGVTPAQIVFRWHLQHGVVVIPKSATPERIAANFDLFSFSLTDDEMTRIDGLSIGRRP